VVEQLGAGVGGFAVGDRVICRPPGLTGGAAAERIAVPAEVSAPAPADLAPEAAASLPLAGQTALQALRDARALEPGRRVCILGASGGVGHFAVQLARAHAAEVTGVCSTRNVALAERLGASRVIDYTAEPDARAWGEFDSVIDCVGALGAGELRAITSAHGRVALVAPEPRQLAALVLWPLVSKRRAVVTMLKPRGEDLALLCDLARRGELEVVLDHVFEGLEALPQAFRRSMTGRVVGKVAVRLASAGRAAAPPAP
jgi:NADPH:quinone reductase-like Zn-dependent oxidoreductase